MIMQWISPGDQHNKKIFLQAANNYRLHFAVATTQWHIRRSDQDNFYYTGDDYTFPEELLYCSNEGL